MASPAQFKIFNGTVAADGTLDVTIQQENASVEWDINQITPSGPSSSLNCNAAIYFNGNLLCSTVAGASDTATGPPDVILTRSDVLEVRIAKATAGDRFTVGIWFQENEAGTSQP